MKVFLFAIMMIAQTAFAADFNGKTLLYCDYNGEDTSIYMDLYFDYDQNKDTYHTPEMGVVVDETSAYPEYLWNVTATYSATDVLLVSEKDGNTLMFTLPTNGDQTPSVVLDKANDTVLDFTVQVTGMYNGVTVDAEFICYDPVTEMPERNVLR